MTLTDHTFALAVTLKVTGAMEFAPEPLDHVHDAVKRLMEESEWLLEAIGHREAFGFNFDPCHLQWQMMDPTLFVHEFSDRIFHVHIKDAALQLNGYRGILGSHLNFGEADRGWDFRSPGHGDVNFEEVIRALNHIGYTGPLSVEWEDNGMEREWGVKDALEFVRSINFAPSTVAFDAAFERE